MDNIKKISYDPDWKTKYSSMIATPEQAVLKIKSGQRIFIGTGCAAPIQLLNALAARSNVLADLELVHLLTQMDAPAVLYKLAEKFKFNSFFITANVREIIEKGLGDYTPVFMSEIPRLFQSGRLPLDVALIEVTPPDEHGICSLGVSVDIVKTATENARTVIAQVNPNMPRTFGKSSIHVLDLDILVPIDLPVIELQISDLPPEYYKIAEYAAGLIDDGATIEFGIGRIPHVVPDYLHDKKDLGIHTDMLSDSIVDLVNSGAVTGAQKTIEKGKIVTSFCMGTRKLYDFIDGNPMFHFHPTEFVNDSHIISQNHNMVSINVALEVDLTGQACSDTLGTRFYSGPGGQVDFSRAAVKAEGGKSIIVLPATARDGAVSRIVANLSHGAEVVATRGDVHFIVTEFGVAYLHGKSVQERALALISVAHPDFRAELLRAAIDAKYIRPELASVEGKILIGPQELKTTYILDNGTEISFRPVHPTDEPMIRAQFYDMSADSIYFRFMSRLKQAPGKQIQDFVYVDHRNELMIVGTIPEAHGEHLIAYGGYFLNPKTNRAEVAFMVHDDWHNKGIGTFLLQYLIQIARRDGIAGFTAEVLSENRAMQAVFHKSGCKISTELEDNVILFDLEFQ